MRWRADSNRCTRLCRPLPSHSATPPGYYWKIPAYAGGSTPGRIRTYDLQIRSLLLYPAELRAPVNPESGRPDSNRRPSAPKADALPGCATPRTVVLIAGIQIYAGFNPVGLPVSSANETFPRTIRRFPVFTSVVAHGIRGCHDCASHSVDYPVSAAGSLDCGFGCPVLFLCASESR